MGSLHLYVHVFWKFSCEGAYIIPLHPPLCAFLKLTKALFGSTAAVKFISPHNYTIKKERREKNAEKKHWTQKKSLQSKDWTFACEVFILRWIDYVQIAQYLEHLGFLPLRFESYLSAVDLHWTRNKRKDWTITSEVLILHWMAYV